MENLKNRKQTDRLAKSVHQHSRRLVHTRTHVLTLTCTHVHRLVHTCTHVLTCTRTHSQAHAHTCTHAYTHMHARTHMLTLTCTHIHRLVHTHAYTHTHTHIHRLMHTRAYTHMHAHTFTGSCTHDAHVLTLTRTHVHRLMHTCTHMLAHTHSQAQTHMMHTHSRVCAHMCMRAYTHTCTHTRTDRWKSAVGIPLPRAGSLQNEHSSTSPTLEMGSLVTGFPVGDPRFLKQGESRRFTGLLGPESVVASLPWLQVSTAGNGKIRVGHFREPCRRPGGRWGLEREEGCPGVLNAGPPRRPFPEPGGCLSYLPAPSVRRGKSRQRVETGPLGPLTRGGECKCEPRWLRRAGSPGRPWGPGFPAGSGGRLR